MTRTSEWQFDRERHEYTYRGTKAPGVSEILIADGQIDTTYLTPESRERGTLVHGLTVAYDERRLRIVPRELDGYLTAYHNFCETVRPIYEATEQPRFHHVLMFGGCPDRVCRRLVNGPGVLEIKTGAIQAWHGVQLAGYQLLHPAGERWCLYLKPNGKYDLRFQRRAEDYADFHRARLAWWKRQAA